MTVGRLQAFYGGSVMDWMRTPTGILRAMAEALPRLRADDQLRAVSTVALGSGMFEKRDRRKMLDELETEANGGRKTIIRPSEEDRRAMITGVGIRLG